MKLACLSNTKQVLVVILLNLLGILLPVELFARIYAQEYFADLNQYGRLLNDKFVSDYLQYVNHHRELSLTYYPRRQPYKRSEIISHQEAIPLNIGSNSHYVYSVFSECSKTSSECPTVLLQGDSWAFWLGEIATLSLFSDYLSRKYRVISLGTTSFSPANSSCQLLWLKNQQVSPDDIICFIDQTDLGDDSLRYHSKIIETPGTPFLRVDRFEENEHQSYYNGYTTQKRYNEYINKPIWYPNVILIIDAWYKSRLTNSGRQTMPNSLEPLHKYDRVLVDRFRHTVRKYILSAQQSGAKNLFLFTHPHTGHLSSATSTAYQVNVSTIVNEEVASYTASNHSHSLRVFHKTISPPHTNTTLYPSDYYLKDDPSSHPSIASYKEIARKMRLFINSMKSNYSPNISS